MKKAFAYLRVSTGEQAKGYSLEGDPPARPEARNEAVPERRPAQVEPEREGALPAHVVTLQ